MVCESEYGGMPDEKVDDGPKSFKRIQRERE